MQSASYAVDKFILNAIYPSILDDESWNPSE